MRETTPGHDRLHDLISRQADGLITAEEHAELAAALAGDVAARKQWFLRNDIDLALAGKAVAGVEQSPGSNPWSAPDAAVRKGVRAAAVAGPVLAAAGMAVGVFGTSAVWAFALPRSAFTETVIRVFADSFESGAETTLPALPRGLKDAAGDVWRGDEARVVATRQGIAPAAGGRMLAFERSTYAGENPPASAWSDVYRFVDARPFLRLAEGMARDQSVTARLAARFALAPDACGEGEAYSACVNLYAFDRDLGDSPDPLPLEWVVENCVASGKKKVPLVCGEDGWQRVVVEASLPPSARFVLLHVAAVRDEPKPTSEPAIFRGHFVDDIALDLHVR
jgi:hypothetical protein